MATATADVSDVQSLTPPQLARRWSCSAIVILGHIKAKRLRAFRISPPGAKKVHWRIPIEAVLAWEAGDEDQTKQPRRARRRRKAENSDVIEFF